MSVSNLNNLMRAVEEVMKDEAMRATQGTSRGVLALRVVKRVIDHLRVPVSTILLEFKNSYIHREVSRMFLENLFPLLKQYNTHTNEETNAIEKILSCDYSKLSDLHKIINVFNKRLLSPTIDENIRNILFYIFAVDGIQGTLDLKGYIEHLQYGTNDSPKIEDYEDFKRAHVETVRKCIMRYGWLQTTEAIQYFIFREGDHEFTLNAYPEVLAFYKETIVSNEKEKYIRDAILCQIKDWKRKSIKYPAEPSTKTQTNNDKKIDDPKAQNESVVKEEGRKRKKPIKQNQNGIKKMKKEISTESEVNGEKEKKVKNTTGTNKVDKSETVKEEAHKKTKKSIVAQKINEIETKGEDVIEKDNDDEEEEEW